MADQLLTTVDNPWNPFTHWDEWLSFDTHAGYNTMQLLARVTVSSDELSETDQDIAVDDAMREILSENVLGIYRLIDAKNSTAAPI
jgi:hypothetical protein